MKRHVWSAVRWVAEGIIAGLALALVARGVADDEPWGVVAGLCGLAYLALRTARDE